MDNEHDYKTACEVLLKVVREADAILRKANLRVCLQMDRESGRLSNGDAEENEDPT